jgi:hypothetical protein
VDTFNEGECPSVALTWKDAAGASAAPSSARFSIGDVGSNALVRAWEDLDGTASETVALTADDTAIVTPGKQYEERVLTGEATYPGGTLTTEYRYLVRALQFWPEEEE